MHEFGPFLSWSSVHDKTQHVGIVTSLRNNTGFEPLNNPSFAHF